MELYWDRVFLAVHADDVPLRLREMPARTADLHFFGYPHEYSPDGRGPAGKYFHDEDIDGQGQRAATA